MGRRADRVRVAAAQVSGVAAAYAHVRRISEGEALAEIAAILDRLPADRRQKALDQAASVYAAPGQSDLWYPAASRLLERAGRRTSPPRGRSARCLAPTWAGSASGGRPEGSPEVWRHICVRRRGSLLAPSVCGFRPDPRQLMADPPGNHRPSHRHG
jgi:hypothetical protein